MTNRPADSDLATPVTPTSRTSRLSGQGESVVNPIAQFGLVRCRDVSYRRELALRRIAVGVRHRCKFRPLGVEERLPFTWGHKLRPPRPSTRRSSICIFRLRAKFIGRVVPTSFDFLYHRL